MATTGFRGRLDLHFEGVAGQKFRCALLLMGMKRAAGGRLPTITFGKAMNGGRSSWFPPLRVNPGAQVILATMFVWRHRRALFASAAPVNVSRFGNSGAHAC